MTIQMREARRFERTGLLALDPKAFIELFVPPDAAPANTEMGGAAIVEVRGPLTQRGDCWCDSYEALTRRVKEACESASPAIVLRIDSPGGDATGCFETAREIRAACAAAGKKLYAFVEGRACSAAYAIASAAQYITLAETATAGSIGVLSTRADYSQQNAANGVRVVFITSGARKADGHPDSPISDAELAAEQQIVDSMAAVFFQIVADHRGLKVRAIEQLEARVLHGASAVAAGLADDVATLQSLLARIAAGGKMERVTMDYEQMRAAVEEVAKGEDANAKAAKAALAALIAAEGDGDDPADKPEGDDPADKPKEEPTTTTTAADDDEPEPKPAAAKGGGDLAARAWAKVHELETKLAVQAERDERTKLVASRPDFGPELLSVLKAAPIETVRDMVAKLPKGKVIAATTKRAAADQPDVKPTQGDTQADGVSHLDPVAAARMDRQMGLAKNEGAVVSTPHRLVLGGTPTKKPATVTKGGL
jgi:ClpP class serine protease